MFIKTIAVTYQRKFNLGDYNSVELGVSAWASISEGEDEDVCIQILQDKCREAVREEKRKVNTNAISSVNIKVNGSSVPEDFIPEGEY